MKRFLPILAVLLVCVGLFCLAQAPSRAQGWLPLGAASGGGGSFSLTYATFANNAPTCCSGVTLVDFNTLTWGPGCNALVVDVTFSGPPTAIDVSGISIGGSGGTGGLGGSEVTGSYASNTSGNVFSTIWQTSGAPSGSSGDVGVSFTGAVGQFSSDVSVALYCLISAHLTGVGANSQTFATSVSQSIAVPSGGKGIAAVLQSSSGAVTLTNATLDKGPVGSSVFSNFASVTGNGSTIAVTAGGPNVSWALSEAAWGP